MGHNSHSASVDQRKDKTLSPTLYAHSIVFNTTFVFLAHLQPLSSSAVYEVKEKESSGLSEATDELETFRCSGIFRQDVYSQQQLNKLLSLLDALLKFRW